MLEAGLSEPLAWLHEEVAGESFDEAAERGSSLGRFGRYELLEEIGRGGMGIVYRARDLALNRLVALKMILSGQFASEREVKRFQIEAEAAAKLDHPNIVPIYEFGEVQGQPFLSLKLIEGSDMVKALQGAPMEAKPLAQLIATLARAVHYAHQHGILHRDLKPANILLDANAQPHVTDFGLAKLGDRDTALTLSSDVIGSPNYMAPEQAAGGSHQLTTATDVYSLGAIMYELVSGRAPFHAPTPLETLRKLQEEEPPPPHSLYQSADRDLETICLKCMEKEPARRYGSAQALAEELERWLRGEPIQARPCSNWVRMRKWAGRNPKIAGLVALLMVTFVLGVGGIVWQWWRAERLAREEGRLRAQAEHNEQAAQRSLYAADMLLADQAVLDRNLGRAVALLARHTPGPGQPDLRGWEWHYLNGLCRSDELRTLGMHGSLVTSVRFAPGGQALVSGDDRGTIKVWNPADGRLLRELKTAAHSLSCLEFSPDGRWLAAGVDQRVELREAQTWEVFQTFSFDAEIASVAFSADSRVLVMASNEEIVHRDLVASRELQRYPAAVTGRYTTGRIALSPDGQQLAATLSNHRIGRRSIRDGAWLRQLSGHSRSTTDLAWSPDGRCLASGGMDGVLRLWDAVSGRQVTNHTAHGVWITAVAFSPDGTVLASTGGDQRVVLWRVDGWCELANLKGSRSVLRSLAFAPDGRTLATGGQDGVVRLWETTAALPEPVLRSSALPRLVGDPILSSDGDAIAFLSAGSKLNIWEALSLRERATLIIPKTNVTCFAVGPGGKLAAVGTADGDVSLAEIPQGGAAITWHDLGRHSRSILQVLFSRDGRVLASAGDDDLLKVWSTASRGETAVIREEIGRYDRPCSLSADGSRIAIITRDNAMNIFDTAASRQIASLPSEAAFWDDPAFAPDNRHFAAATREGWLHLWDLEGPRKIESLRGQLLHVHWITFSPDGRRLVIGTGEGTVKIWDMTSLQEVATLRPGGQQRPILTVSFSSSGDSLVAIKKNVAFVWTTQNDLRRSSEAR